MTLFLHGQQGSRHFTVSGSNFISGQYSNLPGLRSAVPASYAREDLRFQLGLMHIPFEGRVYLSTERETARRKVDLFSFRLSPKALLALKGGKDFGSRFFSSFETLELGSCYPVYSELTLNGISSTGVNIEFNPGLFYGAFSYGNSMAVPSGNDYQRPSFGQKLILGKIGVGKKRGTLFSLGLMRIRDDGPSLDPDSTVSLNPADNLIASVSLNVSLFENRFMIQSELNGSMFTRNTESPAFETQDSPELKWISRWVSPTLSTSFDYAYFVRAKLRLRNTDISAGYRHVGTGYESLGNPYLRNDHSGFDVQLSHFFAKRKLGLKAYVRSHHDNLLGWKYQTTGYASYGLMTTIRFRGWPTVVLNYSPYMQAIEMQALTSNRTAQLASANISHHYKSGDLLYNTQLYMALNTNRNILDTVENEVLNRMIMLNQSVKLKSPLICTAGLGYNQIESFDADKKIISTLFSAAYGRHDKWKNTVSAAYYYEIGEKSNVRLGIKSTGKLWKNGFLDIMIQQNLIRGRESPEQDRNETILRMGFRTNW